MTETCKWCGLELDRTLPPHTEAEHCIDALKAEVARLRKDDDDLRGRSVQALCGTALAWSNDLIVREIGALQQKYVDAQAAASRAIGDLMAEDQPTVADPYHYWIEAHRDLLEAHPDSYVAIDIARSAIVLAERDETLFTARLSRMSADESLRLFLVHTSQYVASPPRPEGELEEVARLRERLDALTERCADALALNLQYEKDIETWKAALTAGEGYVQECARARFSPDALAEALRIIHAEVESKGRLLEREVREHGETARDLKARKEVVDRYRGWLTEIVDAFGLGIATDRFVDSIRDTVMAARAELRPPRGA